MGYPMTWRRLVKRNGLDGDYQPGEPKGNIRGDMRRLEQDSRDDLHIAEYAKLAKCTAQQAKAVLDEFFGEP